MGMGRNREGRPVFYEAVVVDGPFGQQMVLESVGTMAGPLRPKDRGMFRLWGAKYLPPRPDRW